MENPRWSVRSALALIAFTWMAGAAVQPAAAQAAAAAPTLRTWTATDGRSFQGVLLGIVEGKARVARADGQEFLLAPASLSAADQEVIRSFLQKIPPPPPVVTGGMLAGYDPSKADFTSTWPREVNVPEDSKITVIEEDKANNKYIYESPHFRFECDVLLRSALLAKLATMFEVSYAAHQTIPLGNRRTRTTGAKKFRAMLFEKVEDYRKAGGPANSAGVYMGETDAFMVPLDSLGVKKSGSAYTYDSKGDFHTLFHEITHQLWADYEMKAGIWMVEGFAEYMALMPFRGNRITLTQGRAEIPDYAMAYGKGGDGGRALGKEFTMPRLEKFMTMDQPEFYKNMNSNYGCGLLLIYYFAELDGARDGKLLRDCFKAMHDGARGEEARKVLLNGRTYDELQAQFAVAMRKCGAKITFK
jgi:hypothetical protein